MKINFPFLFILPVLLAVSAFSQELDCTININNLENISSSQRDYLRGFKSDIEKYLNSTRFTDEDLDGEKIRCSMEIFFQSALSNNRYQAKVVITSLRPIYNGNEPTDRNTLILRISDNNWEFTYLPNQQIVHDEMIFNPLTSFLDFYAYLIIGYDLETYVPMSGSQCFQKAQKITQTASTSAVSKDWQIPTASYSKFAMTDELSNVKFNRFRSAFNNYHFDGIDLLATDQQKGLKNILKALEVINDVHRQNTSSVIIKQFFDSKYREIAEIFQTYPEKGVYETLSTYDQEHRSTYQEWMTK
jgi:hypothetical protein